MGGVLLKGIFKNILFLSLFLERGEEREKERERNMDVREKHFQLPHIRDWTCNPGMCSDWKPNWRPFALQDDAQPTEPRWSGLKGIFEAEFGYFEFKISVGDTADNRPLYMQVASMNRVPPCECIHSQTMTVRVLRNTNISDWGKWDEV